MGWITISMKRNELINNYHKTSFNVMSLSNQYTAINDFANAIADGNISASEFAQLGGILSDKAMFFAEDCAMQSSAIARMRTQNYMNQFNAIQSNPATAYPNPIQQANLSEISIYNYCLEQARKEYVQNQVMPMINEKEKELETLKTNEELKLKKIESELGALDGAIDSNIQRTTIKLS